VDFQVLEPSMDGDMICSHLLTDLHIKTQQFQ